MGILDSIFGTNTTANQQAETGDANDLLSGQAKSDRGMLWNAASNASTDVKGYGNSARNAYQNAAQKAQSQLKGYDNRAVSDLNKGVNNSVNTIESSNSQYSPYVSGGQAATGMLDNALGVNGAAGNAAATQAFQAAPGYQFQVDQADDQAARQAAANGMGASGNTLAAIAQLSGNLANQNYQQYITNLQNQSTQGLTAANSVSGNNQAAGGAQLTGGTTGAGLIQGTGTALGTVDTNLGSQVGGNLSNVGSSLGNIQTGTAQNVVNATNPLALQQGTNDVNLGIAEDKAANANSGIFSNLISNTTGGLLSGLFPSSSSTGSTVSFL